MTGSTDGRLDEPPSATSAVRAELVRDGRWLRLLFCHPKGNILTESILAGLRRELAMVPSRRHLRFVTLESAGDDFSFGASIEEHAPERIDRLLPAMHDVVRALVALQVPTGAIVRGRCLGGGFELALTCDFLFAAENARLGLPEIKLGGFPPVASVVLPVKVGSARAAAAVLTGEPWSAREWEAAGLVTRLAPAGDLERVVDEWFCAHLAPKSAVALRFAAAAVRRPIRQAVDCLLPDVERLYLGELMRTHDAAEGVEAFLQKRPPHWTDS